jgi:2,3-bisphosphoglycerate-independent phosphoglycerate mutase
MARPKPLVLIILDGWGYAPPSKSNAISLARKPTYDKLLREFPNTLLHTSGRFVGLPTGQMGNSEVGHLNIGAGRVVYMDITRLDLMIENGELFKQPLLLEAMKQAQKNGRRLHFLGLLSDGGVHSHENHLYALLQMAKRNGVERAFVHAFLDGRDTPPDSGADYLEKLQQKMREYGIGKIATVSGRYYAMDRDKKWERERKAFDAMVLGKAEGGTAVDPVKMVKESYNRGVNDEFVIPFVCVDDKNAPVGTIRDEDVIINFNFRADRARQITQVLTRESGITAQAGLDLPDAEKLESEIPARELPKNLHYVCMSEYDVRYKLPAEQYSGERDGGAEDAQPARGRDGKVRTRHVLLQRRRGEAVSGRRPGAGAVAEGRHLRPDAGDERSGGCPASGEKHRGQHLRRDGGELCQRGYGWALGQD